MDTPAPDITFWEWLFGGAVTFGAALGGFLYRGLKKDIEDMRAERTNDMRASETQRGNDLRDSQEQRRLMWTELAKDRETRARDRLEDVRTFATKSDINDLKNHLDDLFARHERATRDAIHNRGPVRSTTNDS